VDKERGGTEIQLEEKRERNRRSSRKRVEGGKGNAIERGRRVDEKE
jgi:hypothetical protein